MHSGVTGLVEQTLGSRPRRLRKASIARVVRSQDNIDTQVNSNEATGKRKDEDLVVDDYRYQTCRLGQRSSRVTYQDTVKGSPKRKRVESIPNDTDLLVTDEEVNDAGYGGKEKKGERLSFTEPQVTAEAIIISDASDAEPVARLTTEELRQTVANGGGTEDGEARADAGLGADSDGYAREVMDVALSRESTDIVVSMGRAGPLDPPSPEADSMIDDMGENGGRVGSGLCDSTDDGRAHYRRVEADPDTKKGLEEIIKGRAGDDRNHGWTDNDRLATRDAIARRDEKLAPPSNPAQATRNRAIRIATRLPSSRALGRGSIWNNHKARHNRAT
ncbi:hypothetical protein MMC28_008067 [Mycoblastus sanguinarius]|nr:hypothetical protein [Mycoblastus sanguinarius]